MPRKKKQLDNNAANQAKKRRRGRPKSEIPMIRKTYHLPVELAERIEACAYWQRMTISAVLTDALQQYFKSRRIKPIPKDSKSTVGDFFG
ncbi:MAG: hypothetical protein ACYTFW_12465 [Planctomycetota bacterium]|jgi:hypothetical protein